MALPHVRAGDAGTRWLRNGAILSFFISMSIVLAGGIYSFRHVPPIPQSVVDADGRLLADGAAIRRGQQVFQRYGLMDHGSVWGHGTLRGPDFSALTLHRMGQVMRDPLVRGISAPGESAEGQASAMALRELKTNRYDPATAALTLTREQAIAFQLNRQYWGDIFEHGDVAQDVGRAGTDNAPAAPRPEAGAATRRFSAGFLPNTVPTAQERQDIADFFFWTAWAAVANRPGQNYSYTNNWPADATVGNAPPAGTIVWTILSIMGMLAVLGAVIYVVHRYGFFYAHGTGVEAAYRLMESPVTPSQRATAKFFLVAALMFVLQILNGGLLANYTLTPGKFYLQFVGEGYSYSWAKTWHVQLAVLWISVAWIGTAAYLGPLIAGKEPRGQKLLVNLLFLAALVVVGGSLLGEVFSIKGLKLPWADQLWFWLGHQGWEYLELGRLWQILLFGAMIFWLVIVYRTLAPVLARSKGQDAESQDRRALVFFYVFSAILVVAFFGFGLFYNSQTHISIADFWRWFVVHIWVESIFEFFGVAVVALFLVTLGLVSARSALRVAYLTAILVFFGGIAGVAHHYYWFGGPSLWLAVGGIFSSLETIPLILLVVRAWLEYRSVRSEGLEFPYRWPLFFLVASSVWNFIGACIFGFIINLPIVNYYEHSTYLTSNHAHTALFGVYGLLAISLLLFSWRGLVERKFWNEKLLAVSFWSLNGGLLVMFATTLLPIGLMQVWHTYSDGLWWARSGEFYNLPLVKALAHWRIVPDMVIIVGGALPLLYFLLRTYRKLRR